MKRNVESKKNRNVLLLHVAASKSKHCTLALQSTLFSNGLSTEQCNSKCFTIFDKRDYHNGIKFRLTWKLLPVVGIHSFSHICTQKSPPRCNRYESNCSGKCLKICRQDIIKHSFFVPFQIFRQKFWMHFFLSLTLQRCSIALCLGTTFGWHFSHRPMNIKSTEKRNLW